MTTLSTHDTKRSEDVRARLVLLSEDTPRWARAVTRLLSLANKYTGPAGPDRATQYFVVQTLIGAYPIDAERLGAYAEKASREAKLHTSWTSPDPGFDAALRTYVDGILGDSGFMAAVADYVGELIEPGRVNALAQKLVQLTMPGIPDTYQGSELWELSLVDPDNRRPVDFGERARIAAALDRTGAAPRVDETGAAKLHLIRSVLRLRRRRPELFGPEASYEPLEVGGAAAPHVIAFCRAEQVVTVVPRLILGLRQIGGWKDTAVTLPPGEWVDVLTGKRHGAANAPSSSAYLLKLLRDFPVALLVARDAAGD